jgi:hypothetical protein
VACLVRAWSGRIVPRVRSPGHSRHRPAGRSCRHALPASAASRPRITRIVWTSPRRWARQKPVARPGSTVNDSPASATSGPNLLRRPVTSIVASMRMVISSRSQGWRAGRGRVTSVRRHGLAGIGQLADIATGQRPCGRRGDRRTPDRLRDRRTGPTGQASLPSRCSGVRDTGVGRLRPVSGGGRAGPRPPAR